MHTLPTTNQKLAIASSLLMLVAMAAAVASGKATDSSSRPNVLIIYTDDQGSIDVNCYGATDLKTPNLDGLAQDGVRFTQMLAPAPICSASRVGLLTGRMPIRAGQAGNGPLSGDETTIAEVFAAAGYRTGHVGKWHLGKSQETYPLAQGFATSFGHMEGCIDNYSHFFFWNGPNRHDLWRDGKEVFEDGNYFPDLMERECKSFFDQSESDDRPFFLYWAFNAPHYPYQGTSRWRDEYRDLENPRARYAAFVSTADEYIGRVIQHLKSIDEYDNTIILFQSDHGHSTETRAFGGGGNSGPYRGAKQSLFEGGLRVPSVVVWKQGIPQNEVRDEFVTGCDWFPTLCELANIELPQHHLDGKSIVDVIKSSEVKTPHDSFQWQFGYGRNSQWAVREGDWKLIGNPVDTTLPQSSRKNGGRLDAPFFLANLASDVGETTNLADENSDVVERLLQYRTQLLQELGEKSQQAAVRD